MPKNPPKEGVGLSLSKAPHLPERIFSASREQSSEGAFLLIWASCRFLVPIKEKKQEHISSRFEAVFLDTSWILTEESHCLLVKKKKEKKSGSLNLLFSFAGSLLYVSQEERISPMSCWFRSPTHRNPTCYEQQSINRLSSGPTRFPTLNVINEYLPVCHIPFNPSFTRKKTFKSQHFSKPASRWLYPLYPWKAVAVTLF